MKQLDEVMILSREKAENFITAYLGHYRIKLSDVQSAIEPMIQYAARGLVEFNKISRSYVIKQRLVKGGCIEYGNYSVKDIIAAFDKYPDSCSPYARMFGIANYLTQYHIESLSGIDLKVFENIWKFFQYSLLGQVYFKSGVAEKIKGGVH